jgi:hypothetical protein
MKMKIPWSGLFYGLLVSTMFMAGLAHVTKDIWIAWLRGESLISGTMRSQTTLPDQSTEKPANKETTTLVIFKSVPAPGKPSGFVTTGIRFRSDDLSKPVYQYCYFSLPTGGIERLVRLAARKGSQSIRYAPLSNSQARSISRTARELRAMAKNKCRLMKPGKDNPKQKKSGIAA